MNTAAQDKDLKENKGTNTNKTLVKETISYFDNFRFPKDVKNYKQYFGFNLDRLLSIDEWQANISYPIGASIVNSTFANMYDFGYEFGVLEEKFRNLLNETFDYKNQGRDCLRNMIKEGLITGKAFCRTSLTKEVVKIKVFGQYEESVTIKKPSIRYLSKFNVFYDHNYSVEESPFQIERDIMTGAAVKARYSALFDENNESENVTLQKILKAVKQNSEISKSDMNANTGFSNYDYNPVKDILSYQQSIMKDLAQVRGKNKKIKSLDKAINYFIPHGVGSIADNSSKNAISASNLFKFDNQKSYEIIEYEADDTVDLWINGEHITKYDLSRKGVGKIREIEFNSIPGASESLGIMDMIGDLQTLLDSIWNGFIDNIKMQLTGMFVKKGNIDGVGSGAKMRFTKFGIINLKGDADIQRLEMGLGDFMPLNMVQFLEGFISKMVGVNDYQLGGQHKVERVADGIDFMRTQYKSKLAVMIDSIQRLMANIARDWMMTYLTRFTEEEMAKKGIVFSQKDVEGEKVSFINDIPLMKILSEESITFTYNALETVDMERDRERIMTLFQPLAQHGLVDEKALWDVGLGKKFKDIWKGDSDPTSPKKDDVLVPAGKITSDEVVDKYNEENIDYRGTQGEVRPRQESLGSQRDMDAKTALTTAAIAKTPSGAKLQKITSKLNTTDVTDRITL